MLPRPSLRRACLGRRRRPQHLPPLPSSALALHRLPRPLAYRSAPPLRRARREQASVEARAPRPPARRSRSQREGPASKVSTTRSLLVEIRLVAQVLPSPLVLVQVRLLPQPAPLRSNSERAAPLRPPLPLPAVLCSNLEVAPLRRPALPGLRPASLAVRSMAAP